MKKLAVIVSLLGLIAGAFYFFTRLPEPAVLDNQAPSPEPIAPITLAVVPPGRRPRPAPLPIEVTLLPVAEISSNLHKAGNSSEDDMQILDSLLEGYRRAVGSVPAGENGEIVSALCGSNQLGVAVLPASHPAISADGRLLDRWGTPYYFHSISREKSEIRSAGPDRKLWTADDLSIKD